MRQFSIRTLMIVIVAAALGILVLKNLRYWWSALLPLMAGFALEVAILSGCMLRGRHRACGVGFGLSLAGYLALALHPFLSPDLGTSYVLEYAHATDFGNAIAIEPFVRVGHALFALLFGLAGGAIVLWFYSWQKPALAGPVKTANQTTA